MNRAAREVAISEQVELSPLAKNILRLLLYFDIFHHPLKAEEVYQCCSDASATMEETEAELNMLLAEEFLAFDKGYYYPFGHASFVLRRINGEAVASQAYKTAKRFSKL